MTTLQDKLAAIRKRDAEMEYWQVTGGSAVCTDRRVLLGYVDALVAAARAVSVASAAITLHPDGRAYFDSGAATKHFRGALAALREVLDEVLSHG